MPLDLEPIKKRFGDGYWCDSDQVIADDLKALIERVEELEREGVCVRKELSAWKRLNADNAAMLTDREKRVADLEERVEELEAAIRTHHLNVWGEGTVGHDEDVDLYAALSENNQEAEQHGE